MKKYNEIQLTNNKMDLNNRKITNHPPSPVWNVLLLNYFKRTSSNTQDVTLSVNNVTFANRYINAINMHLPPFLANCLNNKTFHISRWVRS